MNIFHVHNDPTIAATMLCDRHVIKMILESAQMLASICREHGMLVTYKSTHLKHPSTIWAGKTVDNFNWLKQHGIALCHEYTKRYGKVHKTEQYFHNEYFTPDLPAGLTTFVQAMPDEYKHDNPVIGYRQYYIGEKTYMAKWKHSPEPLWFTQKNPLIDL